MNGINNHALGVIIGAAQPQPGQPVQLPQNVNIETHLLNINNKTNAELINYMKINGIDLFSKGLKDAKRINIFEHKIIQRYLKLTNYKLLHYLLYTSNSEMVITNIILYIKKSHIKIYGSRVVNHLSHFMRDIPHNNKIISKYLVKILNKKIYELANVLYSDNEDSNERVLIKLLNSGLNTENYNRDPLVKEIITKKRLIYKMYIPFCVYSNTEGVLDIILLYVNY